MLPLTVKTGQEQLGNIFKEEAGFEQGGGRNKIKYGNQLIMSKNSLKGLIATIR